MLEPDVPDAGPLELFLQPAQDARALDGQGMVHRGLEHTHAQHTALDRVRSRILEEEVADNAAPGGQHLLKAHAFRQAGLGDHFADEVRGIAHRQIEQGTVFDTTPLGHQRMATALGGGGMA